MRNKAKWLQDPRVIRTAGAFLMISPLFNLFVNVYVNPSFTNKWTISHLYAVFMNASTIDWLGRISNFTVGYLMFRGQSSSWMAVLAILAFSISQNLYTFSHYYRLNKFFTVSSLLTNVAFFLLVFEAEYRLNLSIGARTKKQEASPGKPSPPPLQALPNQPTPVRKTSAHQVRSTAPRAEFWFTQGSLIEFDGHGRIGQLIDCTEEEIILKTVTHSLPNLEKRTLQLEDVQRGVSVTLRYSGLRGDSLIAFKVVA